MRPSLIIFRGNSGCGKTTTAKLLQKELGYGTMLVSQDVIRREMLRVSDESNNPAIQLIYDLCMYGSRIGYTVILEGILSKKKYGSMLLELLDNFEGEKNIFYFDIPFDETVRRHSNKPNSHEFGEKEMKEWWKDKDYLGIEGECIIDENMTQEQIVHSIKVRDL
ncbi:kinase [Candidatus Saccharibacteria bacterium]|jgi:adenylylsulfate kinase-like enzyme|nr:kinase [Candidatus Saccharibacteria bacterium]